ncbi:MAG: PepSY-associated TM helix domain-containing protein [Cyanobacterium sp.]
MKNFVLTTHKILGITIAFLIIIIAITGSYLVWEREINPAIRQNIHQVEFSTNPNLIENTINFVATNYPNDSLNKIVLPSNNNDSYRLILSSPKDIRTEIYFDPYQKKLLKEYQRNKTFDPILSKLHTELLSGNIGKIILGLSGISLFILGITGLYLWKGWKKLKLGFKVRWKSKPRILNYDLHQFIGIFSFLLVINMAFTGSVLALDKPIRQFFIQPQVNQPNLLTNNFLIKTNNPLLVTPASNSISLDLLLNKAKNMVAEARFTEIKFFQGKDIVELRFKFPHEITPRGKSYITLNSINGEVLSLNKISEQSVYKRVKTWSEALHYGAFWGLSSMVIYLIFGVILVSLSLSGFLIWWLKYITISKPKQKLVKSD